MRKYKNPLGRTIAVGCTFSVLALCLIMAILGFFMFKKKHDEPVPRAP